MIIALDGFMGSGKSSVGRELASRLGCRFIDLDDFVAGRAGRSLTDIFETEGESFFRSMEKEALKEIIGGEAEPFDGDGMPTPLSLVLALGGGTVTDPDSARLLRERTTCIYLSTSATTLAERLAPDAGTRPLLGGTDASDPDGLKQRIKSLLTVRKPLYEQYAALTVKTDGRSVDDIAGSLAGFFSSIQR